MRNRTGRHIGLLVKSFGVINADMLGHKRGKQLLVRLCATTNVKHSAAEKIGRAAFQFLVEDTVNQNVSNFVHHLACLFMWE
jgi:hypothetical protein